MTETIRSNGNWPSSASLLKAPVTVAEIELSEPATVTNISAGDMSGPGGDFYQALVLVRLHSKPLGTILIDVRGGIVDTDSCAEAAWSSMGSAIRAHLACDGLPTCPPVARNPDGALARCEKETARRVSEPPITVIVATRERPEYLAACLDSLARQEYREYEVIVVDNDPVTGNTEGLMQHRVETNLRYAREPQRGLGAAHNRGLRLADGQIIAFTDDDVVTDRYWLRELAQGFQANTNVGCVTGLILPAELQTQCQILLEAFGNYSKGYEQQVFDLDEHRPADPLFPFTAGRLGSGANMSFTRDVLREICGFDSATGAGTVARSGDDLAAFFSVLAARYRLVYQPTALVWHHHRRTAASLTHEVYGYSIGLSAYLTSALIDHPSQIGRFVRLLPAGIAYAFRPGSLRNAHRADIWPRHLAWAEVSGMAFGPIAYGISRWRARAARRP
ncbi:MAG: glycosyl transferase family 2 [Chloroflexi bacterium]|nr:MAG: glycosyl transferase family 2 [Chloroflexota bacterium]